MKKLSKKFHDFGKFSGFNYGKAKEIDEIRDRLNTLNQYYYSEMSEYNKGLRSVQILEKVTYEEKKPIISDLNNYKNRIQQQYLYNVLIELEQLKNNEFENYSTHIDIEQLREKIETFNEIAHTYNYSISDCETKKAELQKKEFSSDSLNENKEAIISEINIAEQDLWDVYMDNIFNASIGLQSVLAAQLQQTNENNTEFIEETEILKSEEDIMDRFPYEDLHNPDLFEENEPGNYIYEDIDGLGKSVSGTLCLAEQPERNDREQLKAGGESRRETGHQWGADDGGHLIGARFGGAPDGRNLVAQNRNINRGAYKRIENQWETHLRDNDKVFVHVETYDENRPTCLMGYAIYENEKGERNIDYFSLTNEQVKTQEEWNETIDEIESDSITEEQDENTIHSQQEESLYEY